MFLSPQRVAVKRRCRARIKCEPPAQNAPSHSSATVKTCSAWPDSYTIDELNCDRARRIDVGDSLDSSIVQKLSAALVGRLASMLLLSRSQRVCLVLGHPACHWTEQ